CLLVGFAVGVPQRRRFQRGLQRPARVEPSEATVVLQEAEDEVVEETEDEVVEDRLQQKPWLQRHLPHGGETSEDLLLHFMQALEERGVQLYEAQEEAIVEIFSGAHVVLDTPTGSGKSLVAVAALFKALAEGGKAYYTSPTKALTSEKFFDLCRHFGPASVGMATGDISLNQRAPLICCTAEVLASISLHEGQASGITTVVMDEFHYFADPDRGSAWEVPLWRMTGTFSSTTFLLMSGTLGANDSLYRTLQSRSGRPVRVVSSQDRPVPLHFAYSEGSVAASVAQLIRSKRFPVYIVHFSQREALRTAQELAEAQ
ncbi:helY, partial [Symbiodinium sp. CCMP2456]